jgi:chromosome segregation ATPase
LGVRLRVRLENQLAQVIQGMTTMQQNMTVMQQNMTTMQQNMTTMQQNIVDIQQNMATKQDLALVQRTVSDIRTDIAVLSERVDSLEATTRIGIRDSIRNQRSMINNLNYDLANQERASNRLRSRVERLEDINNSIEPEA